MKNFMEYCELLLNIAKEFSKLLTFFTKVVEIQTILNNMRWHLTVFSSDFEQYLPQKCWHITEFNEKLWDFMKVYKSWRKLRYCTIFFGSNPLLLFCFIQLWLLFEFRNFVLWQMKFFCLLLYSFASRQYRQIFCHCQTIGDISNIADTY